MAPFGLVYTGRVGLHVIPGYPISATALPAAHITVFTNAATPLQLAVITQVAEQGCVAIHVDNMITFHVASAQG